MDCSLPGSSLLGILQARLPAWAAILFSRGYSWPRDQTWVSSTAGRLFTIWEVNKIKTRRCNWFAVTHEWYRQWGQRQSKDQNHRNSRKARTVIKQKLLQEGKPLPGPETGLLSNTQKWIIWGDTCADKARDFIGEEYPGGAQYGKGTQENCSAMQLTVSGFMVMGLVSGLSLTNHSDSESFLVVHALFSQNGCQWGFWEVVGHVVSPFDLSRTLPVGGGLLVPCSLPGPPVVKPNSCK